MSSIRSRRSEAGFTMMELLITMTLAGILMAVAVPSFRSAIISNRLTTQANDIVAGMTYARSEAISHNTSVTFCRANLEASTNCSGSSGAWAFWIVRNSGGVLRRGAVPPYDGTYTLSSTLVNDTMVISSDGMSRSGGALISDRSFTLCNSTLSSDNVRTVTIGAGSRITTEKSTGGC
ncbi:MAG: GspH/FimT family pseudopilin [Peristeroidobacter soli]